MRVLAFASLIALSSLTYASEWSVVAETNSECPERVQILAKEGESYVRALMNGQEQKLLGEEAFHKNAPRSLTFEASAEGLHSENSITFTKPGMVESNLPKLDIVKNGLRHHCNIKTK